MPKRRRRARAGRQQLDRPTTRRRIHGKDSQLATQAAEVAMLDWNRAMIDEFRAKNGKGVGQFGDRLLLLTTTGARSGVKRTTPLMYHRDGERYVVVASKAGAPD